MAEARVWSNLTVLLEADLRTQIVLPLLAATPGLSGITDVHGKNEKGLDIIFFEESQIATICYGLQLKRGDIGGGGTRDQTVKQIIDQLELAKDLAHPVAVEHVGRFQIDKFIVATSGRISETAREEIVSRLVKTPVLFWDGIAITRRIRKHIPELFSAADGTAVAYLKAIITRYDALDSLDQIPGVAHRTLTQIYEEPALRRKFDPAIAGAEDGNPGPLSIPALTLSDLAKNSVVIADQDGGKTSLLRMLTLKRAREILGSPQDRAPKSLPILVRAKDVLKNGSGVLGALRLEMNKNQVPQLAGTLEADLGRGRYLVFVDGFSEFAQEQEKRSCQDLLTELANTYASTVLIVAARPSDFLTPKYFGAFRHYVIQDFDQRQVASLLNRWTSDSPSLADVAKKMVRRVREALQLPGSPVSATIGVMLYEHERRYITNIAEAIDRYMVIRLGRYAYELGVRQEVEWTRKQDLLSEIAFEMVENETEGFSETEMVRRFDETFAQLGEDPRGETVLSELLESGVLIRDGGLVMFHRNAFRDFFAAHGINQRPDRDAFFRKVLTDRKWGLALVFAAGLRRKNSELLLSLLADVKALRDNAIGEPSSDYFYVAYLLGRILSNSELSKKGARLAVLKRCLAACKESMPGFVEETRKQFGNIGEVAALVGVEYSFFVTVGVPWLQNQFRELLDDPDLGEEERYLLASTYTNLGCPKYLDILEKAASETRSTRVLIVLSALIQQIPSERNLSESDLARFKKLDTRISRRLAQPARQAEWKELLKFRSKAIELEVRRLRRLSNQ